MIVLYDYGHDNETNMPRKGVDKGSHLFSNQ